MPLEPKAIDPKHLADIEKDLPGIGQGYNTGNLSARYHKDVTALLADRRQMALQLDLKELRTEFNKLPTPATQAELDKLNRVCKALEERNGELRLQVDRLESALTSMKESLAEVDGNYGKLQEENAQLRKDIDELVKEETQSTRDLMDGGQSVGSGMDNL